jgi:TonB family protein
VDIRSALGRGGGGRGGGWGGILGDPIPLDSSDPTFSDWLVLLRRAIQANMTFPCVKDPTSLRCDPRDARLVVLFGISKEGRLQAVEVMRTSGFTIYDDNSVTAIKLAAPFPPVPTAIMATRPFGSTGIPITAFFNYVVTTWTQTIVR